MKKYLGPILLSIIVGFILGYYVFNKYGKGIALESTFKYTEKVYFLQLGVYTKKENMEKNVKNFNYYIYNYENNKYYVYIGITKTNLEKLKGFYKKMGYIIYEKEFDINDETFIALLNQYDNLLKETTDEDTIKAICSQVLSKYEEMVLNDNQD